MKVTLLALTFFTLSFSLFAYSKDEGGWSSSGGGEYIINTNNPWFMGQSSVKWCLDHGGADKFSLSIESAKNEIAIGISILTKQLESINSHNGDLHRGNGANGWIYRKQGISLSEIVCTENCAYISDQYEYTSNCAEADIEFILGNYNNEKIQKIIAEIGIEKFKKVAGIAIRTEYSEKNLRGKGFIYIAADKGEFQYEGARNTIFKSSTIWDYHEKLNPEATFPKNVQNTYSLTDLNFQLKLKEWTMGPLTPIIAHEFGHVLGVGHNHNENIMDEDYPANVISTGLAFKGNFQRESMILSRGLIEVDLSRQLGFDWGFNRIKLTRQQELAELSPSIYKMLFDFPAIYTSNSSTNIFFIFDFDSIEPSEEKGTLRLATLERRKLEYKVHKEYKIEFTETCPSPSKVESINFRREVNFNQNKGWTYDSNTKTWVLSDSNDVQKTETVALLSLGNNFKCGKIYLSMLDKKKFLLFRLSHNYFGESSGLELIDPSNNYVENLFFSDSNIFGRSGDKLPPASPAFYF